MRNHLSRLPRLLSLGLIALALPALLSLSGCTALSNFIGSPAGQVVAPDVVNLAVAATIGTNKATVLVRAQKIKDIASTILVDETALTSLPTLEADINAQIAKLNLPGPDLILAQQLAAALEIAANVYLTGTGKTAAVATASIAIQTVLNQVIAEAKAFGAV